MQHIPRPVPPPLPPNITTDAEQSRGARARSTTPCCALRLAVAVPSLLCGCPDPEPDADPAGGDESTTTDAGATSGATSTGPHADTSGGSDDSGEPGDAEGSAGTTADEACTVDDDCVDPTAPVCIAGMCLGCDHAEAPDEACAAIDPTRAVCGEAGACVQCSATDSTACDDVSPICNPDTSRCEGCVAHEQCPDTACDIETGACFSDECVLYVPADEDATVTEALDTVGPGESCVIIVDALDEFAALDHIEPAPLDVTDGRRIALRGNYGTTPPRIIANDELLVNVGSLATLYISDLRLRGGSGDAVVVNDGTLHLDRTQIESWGVAVRTTNPAARLRLRNSTLFGYTWPDGVLAVVGGDVDANFVSILGNEVAVSCDATAAVAVRNSLLLAYHDDTEEVDCGQADISYSALSDPYPGDGNQSLGPAQLDWFVAQPDDLHLSDEHPALLEVTARWTTGDPLVDLDRTPRTARDGAMTFAGADAPTAMTTSMVQIGAAP